jgi:hypothetical protein
VGNPLFPGDVIVTVGLISKDFGRTSATDRIPIPAGSTPDQKAQLIANEIAGLATAFGASLTFADNSQLKVVGVSINGDQTGESNTLSIIPDEPYMILQEFPTLSPRVIPPMGTTFTGFVSAPSFPPFTFSVIQTGTQTAGQLFSQMQGLIASHMGVGCDTPIAVVVDPTLTIPGCQTAPFDPATFTIHWDANTSYYLGNFGVEAAPAPVPEPTSLLLLGTALLGLRWRVKRG